MSTPGALEFEKPVKELEAKITELSRLVGGDGGTGMESELEKLRDQAHKRLTQVYNNLDPWQKCQVARHPDRPQFMALADQLLTDYQPLSGDRNFGDDKAILGGLAHELEQRIGHARPALARIDEHVVEKAHHLPGQWARAFADMNQADRAALGVPRQIAFEHMRRVGQPAPYFVFDPAIDVRLVEDRVAAKQRSPGVLVFGRDGFNRDVAVRHDLLPVRGSSCLVGRLAGVLVVFAEPLTQFYNAPDAPEDQVAAAKAGNAQGAAPDAGGGKAGA